MYDEDGDRLFRNTDTNGRFHSDWCSMIYSRLMLARNLLTDDGLIFISIDDNENASMRELLDEVLGAGNFVACIVWQKIHSIKNDAKYFSENHEYALVYAKNIDSIKLNLLPRTEEMNARYKNPDNDYRGAWQSGDLVASGERSNGHFIVKSPKTGKEFDVPQGKHWVYSQENLLALVNDNQIWFGEDGNSFPRKKRFLSDVQDGRTPNTLWLCDEVGHNQTAARELKSLFDDCKYFDFPKPVSYIHQMLLLGTKNDSIILDFFSGSATTAHAVMQLNAEDGGHRKFIMVQLPEKCDEQSEAYKAGYKNICDIGKERIRRAGEKILADFQGNGEKGLGIRKFVGGENDSRLQGTSGLAKGHGSCEADLSADEKTSEGRDLCLVGSNEAGGGVDPVEHRGGECPELVERIRALPEHSERLEGGTGNATSALQGNRLSGADGNSAAARATERNRQNDKRNDTQTSKPIPTPSSLIPALDVGFRVFKLDDTNMKDVYYAPDDYDQGMLSGLESNIKEDRTDLDLLFGCLIDWGLPLSLPYKSEQIDGCTVHTYNDGDLIACFDKNVPESVVKEIAKRKPLRAVFRDSGFASSPEKINVFEIFKLYMPEDAGDISKRVRVI